MQVLGGGGEGESREGNDRLQLDIECMQVVMSTRKSWFASRWKESGKKFVSTSLWGSNTGKDGTNIPPQRHVPLTFFPYLSSRLVSSTLTLRESLLGEYDEESVGPWMENMVKISMFLSFKSNTTKAPGFR